MDHVNLVERVQTALESALFLSKRLYKLWPSHLYVYERTLLNFNQMFHSTFLNKSLEDSDLISHIGRIPS